MSNRKQSKDFAAVTKAAGELAADLGPTWMISVWENLGWYYSVESSCGRLKIHPNILDGKVYSYSAFLGDADSAGGYWAESGKTPQLAIAAVYAKVLQEFKKIGSFVAMFEKAELYSLLRD